MRLKGKVELVTGAGSGNGAGIAKGFLRIIIFYRHSIVIDCGHSAQ